MIDPSVDNAFLYSLRSPNKHHNSSRDPYSIGKVNHGRNYAEHLNVGALGGTLGGILGAMGANQGALPKHRTNAISCFTVENDSFLEVRDCAIKSIMDKEIFDKALDHYLNQKIAQFQRKSKGDVMKETMMKINESIKTDFVEKMRMRDNEINDYCFVLNYPAKERTHEYQGLVSLCSTTISAF
jgi:hypothetical protein